MALSESQLLALHNLADKEAGRTVPYINIADAQALTAQGFARRSRSGWEITLEGACLLQNSPRPQSEQTIEFSRPHRVH